MDILGEVEGAVDPDERDVVDVPLFLEVGVAVQEGPHELLLAALLLQPVPLAGSDQVLGRIVRVSGTRSVFGFAKSPVQGSM